MLARKKVYYGFAIIYFYILPNILLPIVYLILIRLNLSNLKRRSPTGLAPKLPTALWDMLVFRPVSYYLVSH